MAGSRAPILVGLLAIAGGIAWFALRDSGSGSGPADDPSRPGRPGSAGSGKAAISAPEGPILAGSGSAGTAAGTPIPALPNGPDGGVERIDAPSHRDRFTEQPRDPAWANRTEGVLEAKIRKLAVPATVQPVDCRTDQCELTITGSAEAIDATIASLEGPNGLSTVARSLLLGGPERRDDKLTLRVYALFDR